MTIRKFTLACAATLLITAPAQTQKTDRLPALKIEQLRAGNWLPPAEFDHEYAGVLTVHRGTQQEMLAQCPSKSNPGYYSLGCSRRFFDGATCVVYIAKDIMLQAAGWPYDLVLRHELGHCNGWHHD
jgi:hypothetical protein